MELNDGHGWNGPEIVRIKDREKSFDDLWEFVIDFEMDAGREKRERLEHALDVGVFAFTRLELQTGSDFRITLRELGTGVAEEAQLSLVVKEEIVSHYWSFTL
jgi:hypothetical protein